MTEDKHITALAEAKKILQSEGYFILASNVELASIELARARADIAAAVLPPEPIDDSDMVRTLALAQDRLAEAGMPKIAATVHKAALRLRALENAEASHARLLSKYRKLRDRVGGSLFADLVTYVENAVEDLKTVPGLEHYAPRGEALLETCKEIDE